jgi:carboxyl-terminal processing protease
MPRRNLYLLFAISLVSIACYIKADAAYRDRYAQMSLTFIEAMKQIDQSYVEPVPDRQLFEGAMHGMVAQLGDPYSAYEPPRQAREFREELDQQFGGIGIECDPNSDPLTITLPMPGTPAQQAGILAGDQISAIDGQPTKGMKFDDCRRLMRGEPGSTVRLTIERPKEPGSRVVEIVRAVIQTPSIVGDRRDAQGRWIYTLESHPNIGYLHIASFGEQTVNELETALASLEAQLRRHPALGRRRVRSIRVGRPHRHHPRPGQDARSASVRRVGQRPLHTLADGCVGRSSHRQRRRNRGRLSAR